GYETFWHTPTLLQVGSVSVQLDLRHWVNDAAMSLFFLVVGLEISREVTVGELHSFRSVIVPALGAVGGLVLPAVIYALFQSGGAAAAGGFLLVLVALRWARVWQLTPYLVVGLGLWAAVYASGVHPTL